LRRSTSRALGSAPAPGGRSVVRSGVGVRTAEPRDAGCCGLALLERGIAAVLAAARGKRAPAIVGARGGADRRRRGYQHDDGQADPSHDRLLAPALWDDTPFARAKRAAGTRLPPAMRPYSGAVRAVAFPLNCQTFGRSAEICRNARCALILLVIFDQLTALVYSVCVL
jgi:hypothetical protein